MNLWVQIWAKQHRYGGDFRFQTVGKHKDFGWFNREHILDLIRVKQRLE